MMMEKQVAVRTSISGYLGRLIRTTGMSCEVIRPEADKEFLKGMTLLDIK